MPKIWRFMPCSSLSLADLADKFFNKSAGFEQAVKAFNEDFKKQGYLAYHNRMRARSRLVSFLKPDYKQIFIREGADNSSQMLRLQRDYASEVYCTFDESGLRPDKRSLATARDTAGTN